MRPRSSNHQHCSIIAGGHFTAACARRQGETQLKAFDQRPGDLADTQAARICSLIAVRRAASTANG